MERTREDLSGLVRNRIEDWKFRLIDLSRRNNLLHFTYSRHGNLVFSRPEMDVVFNRLAVRKGSLQFWIPPEEDEGTEQILNRMPRRTDQLVCEGLVGTEILRILKRLYRRSLSDYRERGVRILYATFGMLVWEEPETREEVRSPLIMVPVELSRRSVLEAFTVSVPPVEEEVVLNPALQMRLRKDFKLELPEPPEEWKNRGIVDYLASVAEGVKSLGWRVEPICQLGLFSFYKLVIYNDLDENVDTIAEHPFVRRLAGDRSQDLVLGSLPSEGDVDRLEVPEKTFQVLDADSSQRVCIHSALLGQSFVMQGPPGTGKSQTIANIIGECIAQGKSVLFVSDKMAALEVVYKRLTEVGLSHFCLELHSHKANKQEVVVELKRCIDEQLYPRRLPSALDYERMVSLREGLNNYVAALHLERPPLGKTAYEVLAELSTLEKVPFIPIGLPHPRGLTGEEMQELLETGSQLRSVWRVVEEADFPWRGYLESKYGTGVRTELSGFLQDLISSMDSLLSRSQEFSKPLGLEMPQTIDGVKWLIELGDLLKRNPRPEATWMLDTSIDQLIADAKELSESSEWCRATRVFLLQRYENSIFKLPLSRSTEIGDALSSLSEQIGAADLISTDFIAEQRRLLELVKDTQTLTEEWSVQAGELADAMGLPVENVAIEGIRRLIRIASLCHSGERPEASWLDPTRLSQLKRVLPKAKADYQEHNALKKRLGEIYNYGVFDLDLDGLIERYKGPYKGVARWLLPSFHRDRKEIANATRRGRVPSSVVNDLVDVKRLKALRAEIDSQVSSLRELLVRFFEGYETDFSRVEEALSVASAVVEQSERAPLPEQLIRLVSEGTATQPTLKHRADGLGSSVDRWYEEAKSLVPFLSSDHMPGSSQPFSRTPLSLIREWAEATEKQLTTLSELGKEVQEACRENAPKNYAQLLGDLRNAEEVRRREAWFLENESRLRERFGARFSGLETDWEELASALEWTKKLRELFSSQPIPQQLVEVVSDSPGVLPSNEGLSGQFGLTLEKLANLESRFETPLSFKGALLREMSLEDIRGRLDTLLGRVDELQVWADFKEARNRFSEKGLLGFWNRLTVSRISGTELQDVFRRAVYEEWMAALYGEDRSLGQFRRENHEQLIAEFQRLDRELIRLTPGRVVKVADGRRPHEVWVQANDSEISVLLKEAAKKRRRMPIRQLFRMMPNLLSILKPCLLMSPLSVSQFLSPSLMRFDLILFDEASQIVPEDAIGAIYRGKAVVVAGDNRQLPPTSFFQKSIMDDYDWDEVGEDIEVYDSILDECLGIGLPIKTLRWHYRSRHEALIAFSNQRFYDGSLITFPSALAAQEGLGVRLVHVSDGVYDRGGRRNNLREADVVADLAVEHFKEYPEKTLGVVTFSIAQMEAVEEAIERRLEEFPELERFFEEDRLQGFFVKNLENVQGDERDVMIFSVGYGRDEKGQMTMNFGPLNRPGGERRLNVAITRAREKVVLVSSIRGEDIDPASTGAEGVLALRSYLDYAEKGPGGFRTVYPERESESALEEEVAEEIRAMGYGVVRHVGCSGFRIDLGVVDAAKPGDFLIGVEFDGPGYRSANSARDRDRLRQQVLESLGWKMYRVWSPSWVARRAWEVKRLKDAIEESGKARQVKPTAAAEDEVSISVMVRPAKIDRVGELGIPYKVSRLKAKFAAYVRVKSSRPPYSSRVKNEFHMPVNREERCRLLAQLVKEEGPVHFWYASERLASAWGSGRVGPRIERAMKDTVSECERRGQLQVRGDFLWPPRLQDVPVRVPVPDEPESFRRIEHIPAEELENSMRLIVYHSVGLSSESLVAETARLFGFQHVGNQIRTRMLQVYRKMLKEGELVLRDDVVTLPR